MSMLGMNAIFHSSAQSNENTITTSAAFLRQASDARMSAMADIGVSTNPDANSSFYNGGKTVFNEKKFGIGINYAPSVNGLELKNVYQLSLSAFYKLDEEQALSFGFRNFSLGEFQFTNDVGQNVRSFNPQEIAAEFGYSRKLSEKFGLGLSARYISSRLAANNGTVTNYKHGNSIAADISAFYKLETGWNFGLALTNLGSKMDFGGDKKSFIPANLSLGTSYNKSLNADNRITFGIEANKLLVPTPPDPSDPTKVAAYENRGVVSSWFKSFGDAPDGGKEELKEVQLGLGTEYAFREEFFLRAGYFYESKLKGNRNYLSTGAGFMRRGTGFNISYLFPTGSDASNSSLMNTFRLSLLFGSRNASTSN